MGLLRALLAISVVVTHSQPILGLQLVGGPAAVQTFFMISGFYMALVLNGKYDRPGGIAAFYRNRFLRIFPIYWITLAAAVTAYTAFQAQGAAIGPVPAMESMPAWHFSTTLLWAASTLGIFLQDVGMFFAVSPETGALYPTACFGNEPLSFHRLMPIPQGWTLGIELTFYLLAPWLCRRPLPVIGALCAGSLALRAFTMSRAACFEPWVERFFPTELFFFCLGTLGCRIYLKHPGFFRLPKPAAAALVAGLALCTLFLREIPLLRLFNPTHWLYYALVALALPFVFAATKDSRRDAWVGEYSYPLYVCHFLVIQVWDATAGAGAWRGAGILAVSLLISAGLIRLAAPLERIRSQA